MPIVGSERRLDCCNALSVAGVPQNGDRTGVVARINHERMPVLLTREEEFDTWLRGSSDEAMSLAREYPAAQMQIVQEGLDKEDLLVTKH